MKLDYKWALNYYIIQLVNLKERHKRLLISDEAFKELKYQNLRWYQNMINYADMCNHFTIEDQDELKELCEEYEERPRNYLYSLTYRHIQIDVFIDDYGQQDYAYFKICNDTYKSFGGAYNDSAWKVFCDEVDYQLEDAYLSGQIEEEKLV